MILASALSYTYPVGVRPALRDITLSISTGELVLITGPTAAGKTTLCYALSGILHHEFGGTESGFLSLKNRPIADYAGVAELNQHVSIVFDDADAQLIFTSVEEELASGLETRMDSKEEIEMRVREVMDLCGISHLKERPPYALSGGQKQRVALAAALAMDTDVIILDEPTSELDVLATTRIIEILHDLKQKGKTIIIVDHSLEGYRNVADRVVVMGEGMIKKEGTFDLLFPEKQGSMKALYDDPDLQPHNPKNRTSIVTINNLVKRYGEIEALRGVSLKFYEGEFIAILGENGSGKTTLVKHLNGLLRPDSGKITVKLLDAGTAPVMDLVKETGLVFQNPDTMLFADSVRDEILFGLENIGTENPDLTISEVLSMVSLSGKETIYPRHLSRGERQRLAVACILAMKPEIIILDEPTTGLDEKESDRMMELMLTLQKTGHTIIMVTHNMRIAEMYADRIIAMENGRVIGDYHNLKRMAS
ncbi:ABC transporter ATP-binding protein [Methanospirillum stamsii]|uniref:ABC transporter ATP-binding protein n=1 Tax=Methanospirillum stamsii TaxID=1277351 RepID=A0A2V2N624_9EURY|nr:energy-coupling factor transporter ATPase [Methanospirillum stamsii]PWR70743.1 ABC transporter ATP-binding protein [Methanospirillum stamsii]